MPILEQKNESLTRTSPLRKRGSRQANRVGKPCAGVSVEKATGGGPPRNAARIAGFWCWSTAFVSAVSVGALHYPLSTAALIVGVLSASVVLSVVLWRPLGGGLGGEPLSGMWFSALLKIGIEVIGGGVVPLLLFASSCQSGGGVPSWAGWYFVANFLLNCSWPLLMVDTAKHHRARNLVCVLLIVSTLLRAGALPSSEISSCGPQGQMLFAPFDSLTWIITYTLWNTLFVCTMEKASTAHNWLPLVATLLLGGSNPGSSWHFFRFLALGAWPVSMYLYDMLFGASAAVRRRHGLTTVHGLTQTAGFGPLVMGLTALTLVLAVVDVARAAFLVAAEA